MSGENRTADGRRIVGLFIPYDSGGQRISEITIQPSTMGHLSRWQAGRIMGAMPLLMELTGLSLHDVENIRHPDDTRVMEAFLDHIHPVIAADIRNGVRPEPEPGADPSPGFDPAGIEPEWPAQYGPDDDGFDRAEREQPLDYDPRVD